MSRRDKQKPKGEPRQVMTADAFSNPLFRLGWGSQNPLEATEYPLTRMTDNYALSCFTQITMPEPIQFHQ